ncbi:MAG: chalcone isomerase family protein [Rickettsiaceae bacterium]|nr:chalcone isomerase family protein [Rickettsiaceae bacterium]
MKNAELVGSGVLRYWMFSVYKASLYAKEGKYNGNPPYALSIEYFRSFSKESIAKRTIEEMQKQGYKNKQNLEKWYELLVNIYPDIKKQDRLTAIALTNGNSIFYHDNKFIGQINSAEFTEKFFAIWLSNKTSEPRLREKLLGID